MVFLSGSGASETETSRLKIQQKSRESRLTTGPRGEVLQRGPFHAEVSVSHHKHFVQNGPVVDEALQHAGRMHISQAASAEDQGHLSGHRNRTGITRQGGTGAWRARTLPAHLVGQRAVGHPGLTNWGEVRRGERADNYSHECENQRAEQAS